MKIHGKQFNQIYFRGRKESQQGDDKRNKKQI